MHGRLGTVSVPTLVIVAAHDPRQQHDVGVHVSQQIPDAQLVEVDSDHYLTLREPELVTRLLEEFLVSASSSHAS